MSADRDRVHVIDHPLVQHKLALLRDAATGTARFRALMHEVGMLLTYEATRNLATIDGEVTTPLEPAPSCSLAEPGPVLISILRAGEGLLSGALAVLPTAAVGHVGLFRNAQLEAVEYYFKVPAKLPERDVLMLDPMLATAHTAIAATDKIAALGPRSLAFVCLVAAPEGLAAFHDRHPDVEVYTAAVDRQLDQRGYILPGLGDAGDRLYGTVHD